MEYEHLFSPIKINNLLVKNRIVAAPIGDYFEEKAMGGAGIVIAGHAIVEPGFSSFSSADEPYIFQKYEYEKTRNKILQIHAGGAKASIELFHGGCDARVKTYAKGPCTFLREDGTQVVGMSRGMMDETLHWYAKTAKEAKEIGFDLIFLHFGHGWLPAQFLSPLFNNRCDEYGGTLENRAKFPLEILKTVREAVGENFPIDMRISANEYVANSIEFEDVKSFLKLAEQYIDTVQISAGMDMNREANVHTVTTNFEEYMPNLKWASDVKKILKIPVSVVGAIPGPQEANQIIKDGLVDMVAFGRAFIADPYWPKKAMEGNVEEISPCVRCMYCYHIATNHKIVACTVNPRYNHETFIPKEIPKAATKKKVVIVGGGPAGIKAAITSSLAGHEVILYEKEKELGGQLQFVKEEFYKKEIKVLLERLIAQLNKTKTHIHLNCEATPAIVQNEQPDAIILAIGAEENMPPIPGLQESGAMTGTTAIKNEKKIGNNIIILGGGTVGSEIGLELSKIKGKNVTIVEMGPELAPQGNMLFKIALRQKMEKTQNLKILLNSKCLEVTDSAMIVKFDNHIVNIPYDNIIVSTGLKSKTQIAESFFQITDNTNMIGDCIQPRNIMDAIFEGHTIAMNI